MRSSISGHERSGLVVRCYNPKRFGTLSVFQLVLSGTFATSLVHLMQLAFLGQTI